MSVLSSHLGVRTSSSRGRRPNVGRRRDSVSSSRTIRRRPPGRCARRRVSYLRYVIKVAWNAWRRYWFDLVIVGIAILAAVEVALPPGQQRRGAQRPDLAVRAVGRGHDPPAARAAAVPVRSPRGGLRRSASSDPSSTGSSPRTRSATSSPFSPRPSCSECSSSATDRRSDSASRSGPRPSSSTTTRPRGSATSPSSPSSSRSPGSPAWRSEASSRPLPDAIERAEHLEREREAEARAAVAEERARIARELHDVVGHSVSVMTVQASAVRRLLTPEQEREREALLVVEQTGREALAEMRRLVGVLRTARGGAGARAAAEPRARREARRADARGGTADAAQRRGRGLAASGRHRPHGLPARAGGPDERAEARATPRRPRCSSATSRTAVELVVRDNGTGGGNGGGSGHGLVGMRERVAVCGGKLEAGPDGRAAATSCARACRSRLRERPCPDRRRPGARPDRLSDDPRGRARHRGRRARPATARRRSRRRAGSSRTSS